MTGRRDPDPEKGDEQRTSVVSLTVTRTTISLNQRYLLRLRPPGHPQNAGWPRPREPGHPAGERPQPGTGTSPGGAQDICLFLVSCRLRPRPNQVGDLDEISQDPKLNVRFPRGHWLDAAVAVALIAAAASAVMTGRGGRPAASPAVRPGTAAPALLPSTVRTRIPLPSGQPGGMTILGSTAWISDWSASQIVGVDLAAGRVTRTLHVGDRQDEPVSMTSGAGSLWVLDFSGPLLRIDPERKDCDDPRPVIDGIKSTVLTAPG